MAVESNKWHIGILFVLASVIAVMIGSDYYRKKTVSIKENKEVQVIKEKDVAKEIKRTIKKADGTVIEETKIIKEKGKKSENMSQKNTIEVKESKKPKWKISYIGFYNSQSNTINNGVSVERRIGDTPFSIGVWAIERIGVGISVGVEF